MNNVSEPTSSAAVELIKQVGFPIAVALWFMFRTDRVLSNFAKEMRELKETVLGCAHNRAPRR